jgi:hypothetical protein
VGEIHPPSLAAPTGAGFDRAEQDGKEQIDITRAEEPLLRYAKRQDVVFWALEHATLPDAVQVRRSR